MYIHAQYVHTKNSLFDHNFIASTFLPFYISVRLSMYKYVLREIMYNSASTEYAYDLVGLKYQVG